MHESIQAFPARQWYENALVCGVQERPLLTCGLRQPTCFFNVATGKDEQLKSKSYQNHKEAQCIEETVQTLLASGDVHETDIAVLTPYDAQRELLLTKMSPAFPGVIVSTIDAFQGQERAVILLSVVRANKEHSYGFLSEECINAAITRAQHVLLFNLWPHANLVRQPYLECSASAVPW